MEEKGFKVDLISCSLGFFMFQLKLMKEDISRELGELRGQGSSKRGIFLAIIILLILLFSLGVTIILVRQRTTFLGRAFNPSTSSEVALENSYLFASPLTAQVVAKEKIRVTIFLLDSQGRGVYGKPVFLGQDERLQQTAIQAVTDELGRAIFDIVANVPGEYLIEARVDNQVIPQRVRVNFR